MLIIIWLDQAEQVTNSHMLGPGPKCKHENLHFKNQILVFSIAHIFVVYLFSTYFIF